MYVRMILSDTRLLYESSSYLIVDELLFLIIVQPDESDQRRLSQIKAVDDWFYGAVSIIVHELQIYMLQFASRIKYKARSESRTGIGNYCVCFKTSCFRSKSRG